MMPISKCRSCGSRDLKDVLNLGSQPLSNAFLKPEDLHGVEKEYSLKTVFCANCFLLQLDTSVDPAEMFSDYVYVTSHTKPLMEHLQKMARSLYDFAKPKETDLAVDIGCNDGSLLTGYPEGRVRRLGIEPSSVAEIAKTRGLNIHRDFFNAGTAEAIVEKEGRAKIVTATNVYAHVPDQDGFLKGLAGLLEDDGMFVIEVPHVLDMLQKNLFDTIYHEHIFYFSLLSLEGLLKRRGFRIFHVEKYQFGPSGPPIRVFICKKEASFETSAEVDRLKEEEKAKGLGQFATYQEFASRVWEVKAKLLSLMEDLKSRGEKILGYGAPAKGNTILNTFHLDTKWLDVILEKNKLKCGLFTPGTRIPVVDEDTFPGDFYKHALLLSWNLKDFLLEKSLFIKRGGKFIIPLPEPQIVP